MPAITGGRVQVQNTSGAAVASLHKLISCSAVTTNSVIVVTAERDANSAAGVEYVVNLSQNSRTPGTGFSVDLRRSSSANLANNEGCTLNYTVMD